MPSWTRSIIVEYSNAFTTVGVTATFSCISGYQLQGFAFLTCGNHGVWSGDFPVCIGKIDLSVQVILLIVIMQI